MIYCSTNAETLSHCGQSTVQRTLRLAHSSLVLRAGTLWKDATAAAFLDSIGDGTLPPEAFSRWLVQDYHFVDALASFQAITAAKAPHQFRKPLIAGLAAIDAELDWFEA